MNLSVLNSGTGTSVTVPAGIAGQDKVLVVTLAGKTSTGVSSLSYNGTPLSQTSSALGTSSVRAAQIYTLVNPTVGTYTLALTGSVSVAGWIVFGRADASNPPEDGGSYSASNGNGTYVVSVDASTDVGDSLVDIFAVTSESAVLTATGVTRTGSIGGVSDTDFAATSSYYNGATATPTAIGITQTNTTASRAYAVAMIHGVFTPSVDTEAVTDIDFTTATGNGNVLDDGSVTITERGVVWNTVTGPTVENDKSAVAGTTGAFTAPMTGLTGNTLYYVRAYAINSQGTVYGDEVTFTTAGATSDSVYKDIGAEEGSIYGVSINVGGTTGSVTVKLGTTGTSQIINAGTGVTTFAGTYGGLNGLIIQGSATFDGTIDDVMYVLLQETADLADVVWTEETMVSVIPINSSVVFRRLEDAQFNRFRTYRYLDLDFKDLDAYVTLTIRQERDNVTTSKVATFQVTNPSASATPFTKKKVSFLSKNQAILIGLSNNNLNDQFTITKYALSGIEIPSKLYSSSNIISVA